MSESTPNSSAANSPAPRVETSRKVELSIQIDPELLDQVSHLSSDPGKVIEVALKQWLRSGRRREDDLTRPLPDNPVVPPKGEWND